MSAPGYSPTEAIPSPDEPANDAASLYEPASRANSEVVRELTTNQALGMDPSHCDRDAMESDLGVLSSGSPASTWAHRHARLPGQSRKGKPYAYARESVQPTDLGKRASSAVIH